jgi:hypothetical protein
VRDQTYVIRALAGADMKAMLATYDKSHLEEESKALKGLIDKYYNNLMFNEKNEEANRLLAIRADDRLHQNIG